MGAWNGRYRMTKQSLAVEDSDVLPITTLERAQKRGRLGDLLVQAIDETMNEMFREEGASAIYGFLENESQLKRENISSKTEAFSTGLRKLLGSGAPVIEKLILKNLCHQLELKFVQKKGHSFSDYAKELTERFYVKG
ncbi:MAG: hypothetical protein OEX09_03435 [Candidatus Bathyarchaeota archaeon]|nr:hypothetical protein [Candidatus Bathyarchaeota archaeon]